MVYFRTKRHDIDKGSFTMKEVVRKPKNREQKKAELARLLFDEHLTQEHEVLCVCAEDQTRGCGLSIFMADREIQWYDEKFPECCTKESQDGDNTYRNALAAVTHWAQQFTLAEAVNLLSHDGKLVKLVCAGTTRQWRSFFQFEKKFSFRLFMQWSDNYFCGEVERVELWEEAVLAADKLIKGQQEDALKELPLEGWKVTRVVPSMECFHMVPHPGEITPKDEDLVADSGDDSDYGRTMSFTTNERNSVASSSSLGSITNQQNSKSRRLTSNNSLANDLRRSLAEEHLNSKKKGVKSKVEDMMDDDVFGGEAAIVVPQTELLLQL